MNPQADRQALGDDYLGSDWVSGYCLVFVVLVQGKWTRVDSWFAAVFASAVMAMVIDHYINHVN
jgi:hypothetical protein